MVLLAKFIKALRCFFNEARGKGLLVATKYLHIDPFLYKQLLRCKPYYKTGHFTVESGFKACVRGLDVLVGKYINNEQIESSISVSNMVAEYEELLSVPSRVQVDNKINANIQVLLNTIHELLSTILPS